MMKFYRVLLACVLAASFAAPSYACRMAKAFDVDKLEADIVVRGTVTRYVSARQHEAFFFWRDPNEWLSRTIVCVDTSKTYLGEERAQWCFDVDNSTFGQIPRASIPDDVIIAAKWFTDGQADYVDINRHYFEPLGVKGSVHNAGCTMPYMVEYGVGLEEQIVASIARLEAARAAQE